MVVFFNADEEVLRKACFEMHLCQMVQLRRSYLMCSLNPEVLNADTQKHLVLG